MCQINYKVFSLIFEETIQLVLEFLGNFGSCKTKLRRKFSIFYKSPFSTFVLTVFPMVPDQSQARGGPS